MSNNYSKEIGKWLCKQFNYPNQSNNFNSNWIKWNIWDGKLTIDFDTRIDDQNILISCIPLQFMGTIQHNTLKIVNKNTFYLPIEKLLQIKYPKITHSILLKTIKNQQSEKGGWYIKGEYWYSYDWEIFLDDNTSILYHNQLDKMDLTEESLVFKTRIQEREFINFLKQQTNEQISKTISY